MDPRSSAQDVHRCDLCETAIVHSYCDFCHVNLCKPCVVDHISDGYDKHKIVPFKERRSTLTYPKCGTHPQKSSEFQCKSCNNILICSSCITSEQHRGHIFLEISEEYKTMKKVIEKETEELENRIFPKYEEIAHDLINQLVNLDGEYEELTTEICKQGEQWHRKIDIIINKMKTEISEMKINHRDILQKHLDEIEQIQSAIKQTLLNMNEILKSTEASPIIEYSSKVRKFSKLPLKLKASKPAFIPKPINQELLYDLIGQISPLSTYTEENILKLSLPKPSVSELLDEPELVATIETGHEKVHKITCFNREKLLTSGESVDIKCFDNHGLLINTIQVNSLFNPSDIAVDVYGNKLYTACGSQIFVNMVKTAQTKKPIIFRGSQPRNLCVTSTGDLLVSMFDTWFQECQVVRYSGSKQKQTIQFDDEGKHLYSSTRDMKFITENKNHDICVADSGGYAVVVVTQDGKLRWRYTGHPSVTKNKQFKPFGITTDIQSRILTADSDNHCIHILDQNGKFLRYIDNCDLKYPYSLCVGTRNILFVSECNQSHVKKIKYFII